MRNLRLGKNTVFFQGRRLGGQFQGPSDLAHAAADDRQLFLEDPDRAFDVDLDTYFAMGRGAQTDGLDVTAMEMTKWFDTNYHYIVPEFAKGMAFRLSSTNVAAGGATTSTRRPEASKAAIPARTASAGAATSSTTRWLPSASASQLPVP